MLDNQSLFLKADPKNSNQLLEKIKKVSWHGCAFEVGAGNGRVTDEVLRHHFDTIDMLEPADGLRHQAEDRMKKVCRPYNKVYGQPIQEFMPETFSRYDAVWIQYVAMYLSDAQIVDILTRFCAHLTEEGVIILIENFTEDEETYCV